MQGGMVLQGEDTGRGESLVLQQRAGTSLGLLCTRICRDVPPGELSLHLGSFTPGSAGTCHQVRISLACQPMQLSSPCFCPRPQFETTIVLRDAAERARSHIVHLDRTHFLRYQRQGEGDRNELVTAAGGE